MKCAANSSASIARREAQTNESLLLLGQADELADFADQDYSRPLVRERWRKPYDMARYQRTKQSFADSGVTNRELGHEG